MYHSVGDNKSFFTTTQDNFEWQMKYLFLNKYHVDTLENVLKNKIGIALTFDDGYLDNLENVLPIIEKYKFPISIFIPTGLIGKMYLNSSGESLQIMNENQIKEILKSDLVTIYPHSHLHKVSTGMSLEEFEIDVSKSLEIIRSLGGKMDIFCYPKGKIGDGTKEVLKKLDFKYALSVKNGDLETSVDDFEINRIPIDSKVGKIKFKIYMSNYLEQFLKIKKLFRKIL